MVIDILFALLITACYLIGGQIEKSVRRYGVPTFSVAYTIVADKSRRFKEKLRYFGLLLMIGILSMGYGESSWLRKKLGGNDTLTRLVYGIIIGVVFSIAGGNPVICIPVLIGAFQIRAGKLFSIGKFDFLIEDIFRAGAIFVCSYTLTKGI